MLESSPTIEAIDMTQDILDGLTSDRTSSVDEGLISRKGGAAGLAARAMKRVAIGRLQASGLSIRKERCDQFIAGRGEHELPFSFRVTAKARSSVWFNVTHAEVERLADRNAVILVLFNPSTTSARAIWAFAVPCDQLQEWLRRSLPTLVISRLAAAKARLAPIGWRVSDVTAFLTHLEEQARACDDPELAEAIRRRASDQLRAYCVQGRPADIGDDHWRSIRDCVVRAREVLETVLVFMHPPALGEGPGIELPQANLRLHLMDSRMVREIDMRDEERRMIEQGLADSVPHTKHPR